MKKIFHTTFILILLGSQHSFSQWAQTQGPPGITLTNYFDNGTYVFVGSESKGAFRSTDHGNSWTAANGNIKNRSVFSFAQDASYLYAGTDSGVFRSTDNGTTWQPANTGIEASFANCLLIANGFLFMGTIGGGVYRSSDHGTTWVNIGAGTFDFAFIKAMCFSGGKVIIEADNYVWYTTDNGGSWNLDTGPTQFYNINRFYTSGDTVIAITGGVYYPSATVFVSFNSINSWFGPFTVDPDVTLSGISRSGNTIYVGSANGLYSSTDFGMSWNQVAQTGLRFGHRLQNDMIHSGENFLLSYEEIGSYRSGNGASWSQENSGFSPASAIDNCMINSGSDLWTGTHSDGVYSSSDGGATWNHSGASNITQDTLPNSIIFSMLDGGNNILFAGGCGDGLYRSADYGATWTHITDGFTPGFDNFLCVFSLAKSGGNILAATNTGMYYSTDLGLTWNLSSVPSGSTQVEGIAVHGNIVCIGVGGYGGSGVYRSTNNGVSFTLASSAVVDIVTLESDNSGNFYAGSLFDFYRSTDDGLTWNIAGSGIPSGSGAFAVKAINENVFVGGSAGIFYSNNNGSSFSDASDGLDPYPNKSVQGITVAGDYIYAGTFRDAIWKRPLSDFDIATATQNISDDENYFRLTSTSSQGISYEIQLSSSANAELKLVDVTGRIVEEVSLGKLSSGIHSGTLPTQNFSSGIYLLSLHTDNFEDAVKIIR